jgi:hypothetical protein
MNITQRRLHLVLWIAIIIMGLGLLAYAFWFDSLLADYF